MQTQPEERWKLRDGWFRKPPAGYESLDPSICDPETIADLRKLFKLNNFPLYLYGKTGVGKSFMAAYIYCRYGQKDKQGYADPFFDALFLRYSDLRDEHMRNAKNGLPSPWDRMKRDRQLVVIDEIGTGDVSETRNELLWKILELRRDKPLILTSNLLPTELAQRFDTRIKSRIMAGTLVEMCGPDLREVGAAMRSFKVGGKK